MPVSSLTKSAAVILPLRSASTGAIELLMFSGPAREGFPHGPPVFPSGRVVRADCDARRFRRCRGLDAVEAQRILGHQREPGVALGHWAAAVRILYEATGHLLCTKGNGSPAAALPRRERTGGHLKRVAPRRQSLDFDSFLETEGLSCDLSRLAYFSRWTSATSPPGCVRYFLARLDFPDAGFPFARPRERKWVWTSAEAAMQWFEVARSPLKFPAFACLRALADYGSCESLWNEYGTRSGARAL